MRAAEASASSASSSTIGHDRDAHRDQRLLERMELRAQRRLDAGAGLVARPELVAERLDDVIGRDADVRRAALDHLAAPYCSTPTTAPNGRSLPLLNAAQAVEVAEELVGAVDEVDEHGGYARMAESPAREPPPDELRRARPRPVADSCPGYDRNPNTVAPLGADAETVVAEQTIHHDAARPSHVLLPVVAGVP